MLRSKMQGMVLVIVLIFLVILAGLNLYMLKANNWEMRMSSNVWHKSLLEDAARKELTTLSTQILTNKCEINLIPVSELLQKELGWWQTNTCASEAAPYKYFYAIESLGIDPCARVSGGIAEYFRISMLIQDEANRQVIAQATTVIKLPGEGSCANGHTREVSTGIQRFRLLL